MPVTHRIQGKVAEIHCRESYDPKDILDAFQKIVADPTCPARFGLLLDVSKSETLPGTPTSTIVRIAEHPAPHRERVVRCAVVAEKDVHFGLSRMGAVYSDSAGIETEVFRSREEALAWLSLALES